MKTPVRKISFELAPPLIETVIGLLNHRAGIETERLFRRQRKLWYTINKFLLGTLFVLVLVPAVLIPEDQANGWWTLYFCITSFIFGAVTAKPLMNFDSHTLIYSSLGMLGQVDIEINDDGFVAEHKGTRSLTPWAYFHGVDEEKDMILLLREPLVANFIPTNAFQSPDDKNLFISEIRAKIEAASAARYTLQNNEMG